MTRAVAGAIVLAPPATGIHLTSSCIGALPCMTFNGVQFLQLAGSYTQAQPLTYSVVSERTGALTSVNALYEQDFTPFTQISYEASANTIRIYGGTVLTATASDNAWHAIQGVLNGASSVINVDNTQTTGNAGAGGMASGHVNYLGAAGGTQILNGKLTELGIHPSAISTANQTALCHNQRLYWSTPGSC